MTRYGHACLNTSKISSRGSVEEGEGGEGKSFGEKTSFFSCFATFRKVAYNCFYDYIKKMFRQKI